MLTEASRHSANQRAEIDDTPLQSEKELPARFFRILRTQAPHQILGSRHAPARNQKAIKPASTRGESPSNPKPIPKPQRENNLLPPGQGHWRHEWRDLREMPPLKEIVGRVGRAGSCGFNPSSHTSDFGEDLLRFLRRP